MLLIQGIDTFSSPIIQARRYLQYAFNRDIISIDELTIYLDIKPRETKLRKKLDGVLS